MKRVKYILFVILSIITHACDSEQVILSDHPSLTCSIQSRSEDFPVSLSEGSQILLNAQGGVIIDNQIFTYSGGIWKSGNDYHWSDTEKETHVIALYPTFPDNSYTANHLYTEGELEDILIAQKTYPEKGNITLLFEHLFSLLILNIEETLHENIQSIQLTVPAKVGQIFPKEGTFALTEDKQTITREATGTSNYSFIIPPMEACTLTLTLIMKDGTVHIIDSKPHTFLSGTKYECNVLQLDSQPGIRTAEDLISFSQLINGTYKGNKSLSDFGKEVDGKMVYSLLNDIELTEDDCNKLEPIGYHTDYPFLHTFDGKGHTISNLRIKSNDGYAGLFGNIHSAAIIKNLNINNCLGLIDLEDNCSDLGIIAGRCIGTITNCHIRNSSLSSNNSSYTGGISGYTKGQIINCSVQSTTIEAPSGSSGVITGYLHDGKVLNSYSCNNTISQKTAHNGGICGYSQNGIITNSYIYANKNVKGQIIGTGNNATVTYCYCDKTPLYNSKTGTCTFEKNYLYTTNFTATSNNTPIYQLLNQWIEFDNTEPSNYIHWEKDSTFPAVFITP